jgi:predicted PurR-regulated permease PerM
MPATPPDPGPDHLSPGEDEPDGDDASIEPAIAPATDSRSVDVRHVAVTTLVVVLVVLAMAFAVLAVYELWRIVTYLLIALFGAVVLTPAVDFLQHRAKLRRGLATFMVFFAGLAMLAALIYAFVKPLVDQGQAFSDSIPTMLDDAEKGKGPVGRVVKKYDLQDWVEEHRADIDKQVRGAGSQAVTILRTGFSGIIAALTVMVHT